MPKYLVRLGYRDAPLSNFKIGKPDAVLLQEEGKVVNPRRGHGSMTGTFKFITVRLLYRVEKADAA